MMGAELAVSFGVWRHVATLQNRKLPRSLEEYKFMKLKSWTLALTLALATVAHAATNDLTGLLQKGLFEEEANRDLTAAIANYQSLASAFDKDRQLAATAIFRLGECYRKLGQTNEAVVQYERIVKEFSDQQTLATLSRQNLTGLNAEPKTSAAGSNSSALLEAESTAASLQVQLDAMGKMSHDQTRVFVQQNFPNPMLTTLMSELDLAQQSLIALKIDYSSDHPKYQNAQKAVDDLNAKIDAQVDGVVTGLREKLAVAQVQLRLQQKRSSDLTGSIGVEGLPGASESATTEEEQTQIRNIQAMIQNSPDLINAPISGPSRNWTPLQDAADKGQLIVAKYLLDHGADVNAPGSNNSRPLIAAAQNGHKAMVELLLARGADANAGNLNSLYEAVSRGFTGVAEVLLANKADVNLRDHPSGSPRPLHAAAKNGNTNLIQLLISHGADVNVVDGRGRSPLEYAAVENQTNTVRMLLAAKADIELRDKEGNAALHLAADAGHPETVSLLLNSGASVDPTNENNNTPLLLAVAARAKLNPPVSLTVAKFRDCVRVLLEHKANPNHPGLFPNWRPNMQQNSSRWTGPPLFFAVAVQDNVILKLLLDAGANPEGDSASTPVPLFSAINNYDSDVVQLLLHYGANPNRHIEGYSSPLNAALRLSGRERIIAALLDKGADPNARDSDGYPALFRTSDADVARELIAHKADVNACLKNGQTALMQMINATNYLKVLLENGAKVDLQETNGNTALHYAVFNSRPDSVAILLEHKGNPNIQNNQGYTPLDLAKPGQNLGPMMGPNYGNMAVTHETGSQLSALLIQAGGLANLPKRDRIEVRRAADTDLTILKDSAGRNRYSLLEVVANAYGIISERSVVLGEKANPLPRPAGPFSGANRPLRFPDFKKVIIYRRTENSAKQTTLNINIEDVLNSGDCSRNVWLEWGDIVEIPEADHPVDENWAGLSDNVTTSLIKCVDRHVTVRIKGENTALDLQPAPERDGAGRITSRVVGAFMLRSVLNNSKLIRVSSDLSRVKITRTDSATKKTAEWVVDCTSADDNSDLWLRDGDVIEVPEK